MSAPASPCTGVCLIDAASGWCMGCRRTLAEIADWPMLRSWEKRAVIARLAKRAPAASDGKPPQ